MISNDDDLPTVTLTGKTYTVPPIPFRYAKKIVPLIMSRPDLTTEAGMDDLLAVVFTGLKASHKDLEFEAFMDGHYGLKELLQAFSVISNQSGLKETAAGEAQGAASPLISTN